uniref:Disease resistant protein n=2 Tax=Oryza sativa subsp. japonica TaxID=39947 RepID=Q53RN8_ORYSJ|nr:putative disease resistant protein [Oryza sativa Japonica Group]AAX95733.1 NB-ARC domain, putative [Oryza sativa Japonica Group]
MALLEDRSAIPISLGAYLKLHHPLLLIEHYTLVLPYLAFTYTSRHSILSMADAVLPAFLQVLFQNAMELLKKKLEFACDIDNEGQKLMSNMEMIQAVLRGGEKMKFNDEQRLWFSDLKDAGYDAMDVLDEYLYEVQRLLPILGEAYIGKTTVAQLIINDKRVSRHFDVRIWAHVSPDFNIKRISASILESIYDKSHYDNLDTLQKHIQKRLRGKRFLLVLDDYWTENWHDWEEVKRPLLKASAGSKVIVTTRSGAVAKLLGMDLTYQLKLSIETSIKLKMEVLQKCNGVPFIAASLGHRLHQKDKSKWVAILQEEICDANPNYFIRARQLSYAQLHSHLKPCFAYCSIIPREFQFEEWLIKHWMAQGFIQSKPDAVATGSSYFRTLFEQSFFQRELVHHSGERHRYSMSRMMHELALHVSTDECYILGSPGEVPEKVRHLTVLLDEFASQNMFETISQCKHLHTLLVTGGNAGYELSIPKNLLNSTLKKLRLLELDNIEITKLPKSIGNLIHLRCLMLQGSKIRKLPESICSLYNLQTLCLRNCYDLEKLPRRIKYLHKLRHIDLHLDDPSPDIHGLKDMPVDIGLLTDLQTLSRFVTSKRNILDNHSNIKELDKLDNLCGELLISNLHVVKDAQEAAQAHLASKQFLQKMELSWKGNNKQAEQILEQLKPPSGIKELTISGYTGISCPIWLGSESYTNLVTLSLYHFKSCTVVPSLWLLPLLENLHIKGWDALVKFCGSSSANFQALKKLHFERMDSLKQWDGDERSAFPALTELVVDNCPMLEQPSHKLRSLTKITVEGSPKFPGLQNFPSLTSANIIASGEFIWGSWRSLSCLTSITLRKLPMEHIPPGLGRLRFLRHLEIIRCEQLVSMPEDWPPCNLTRFSVKHCPQLLQLPNGLQRLRELEDMEVVGCGKLTCLPEMRKLTSLERLEISECGSIQSLPSKGLPKKLQFLSVNKCPWLSSRCMVLGSTISSLWIDGELIRY